MTNMEETRPAPAESAPRTAPVAYLAQCLAALVRDGGAIEARVETHKGRF